MSSQLLHNEAIDHLNNQLQNQPIMELVFTRYGIIRRSYNENGATEVIVSPDDVAIALQQRESKWETGILGPNVIYMGETNSVRTIAEYRPPQITGVWLEGSPEALRIPLPGLVLIRHSAKNKNADYGLFAVKKRPDARSLKLYRAPLPNVFENGNICWGSVKQPKDLLGTSLDDDWKMLLGSGFGNHGSMSCSQKYKSDVRKLLIELDTTKTKRYPINDLVEHRLTLKQEIHHER